MAFQSESFSTLGDIRAIFALWMALVLPLNAAAQSQPEAVACLEKFLNKIASVKGYSAHLVKKETFEGKPVVEPIELWTEGPQLIKYKFVADGSTGIKNNGMTLTYDGGDNVAIVWGETTFLGALAGKAARAVIGNSIPLIGETTLKGEIFTLNHAGFRHMASCMRYHLPALKVAKTGGLKLDGPEGSATGRSGGCKIKHTPPNLDYASVTLKPGDKIQDLEDKYGTFAYHVQQVNQEKFKDMLTLFTNNVEQEIRVPLFFLPFELELDPENDLPKTFILYLEGRKIGEYDFTDVKTW